MGKFLLMLILIAYLSDQVAAKLRRGLLDSNADVTPKPKNSGGHVVSAWGLIFILLTCILVGVAIYYIVIFYPLLCKKERKYDRIELAAI